MSSYAIEILAKGHDRAGFVSGLESVDRYLRETARGHQEKGISVTRVLVKVEEVPPKTVVGFFHEQAPPPGTPSPSSASLRCHANPGLAHLHSGWRIL